MSTERGSWEKLCLLASSRPKVVPPFPKSEGIRTPSMFRCWLVIIWVKLLLRLWGFDGAKKWIRRKLAGITVSEEIDLESVRRAEYALALAAALFPGRALCLEQSLALYYLLRSQGVEVKYCQGVQPYPFLAHAWVEYVGEVVNDVAERPRLFARLPDQLP